MNCLSLFNHFVDTQRINNSNTWRARNVLFFEGSLKPVLKTEIPNAICDAFKHSLISKNGSSWISWKKSQLAINLWSFSEAFKRLFNVIYESLFLIAVTSKFIWRLLQLTLSVPTPQNGQTHSNNSSVVCVWVCLTVLWGWPLKG